MSKPSSEQIKPKPKPLLSKPNPSKHISLTIKPLSLPKQKKPPLGKKKEKIKKGEQCIDNDECYTKCCIEKICVEKKKCKK